MSETGRLKRSWRAPEGAQKADDYERGLGDALDVKASILLGEGCSAEKSPLGVVVRLASPQNSTRDSGRAVRRSIEQIHTLDHPELTRSGTADNSALLKAGRIDEQKSVQLRDYTGRMARLEQRRCAGVNGAAGRLNWEELLYKHGTTMSCNSLLPHEALYVAKVAQRVYKRGWRSFRAKYCYQNCLRLVLEDDARTLRYCEGYADVDCGAFQHAWVTINGKVVDPTLDAADRQDTPSPYRAYFGIEIPHAQLIDQRRKAPFIAQRDVWVRYL